MSKKGQARGKQNYSTSVASFAGSEEATKRFVACLKLLLSRSSIEGLVWLLCLKSVPAIPANVSRKLCQLLGRNSHRLSPSVFVLYTIHWTLYTINSTLNTIHYTLYTIHYTLYTINYTLYTIHYTLYTIHYTLYTIYYTLYTIH